MKPNDLDDRAPIEPDDELLERVHARSRTFRRRRSTQRLTSVVSAMIVLALAGGIAWARIDTTDRRWINPAPAATTTTTLPAITEKGLAGVWRPVSIAGYDGPLTKPPLAWLPRLSFNGHGRWTGSDGCNDIGGTYRIGGDGTLRFLTFASTAVGCLPNTPDFGPIEAAPRIELHNDRLTFSNAGGREIARFTRVAVTARIELPAATITAGSSMSGHIVVENDTGHPLHATGCGRLFQVTLGNDQISQEPAWTQCLQDFTIPPGTSTYPVTVTAGYVGCSNDGGHGMTTCLPGGGPPPLPPGAYRATAYESDTAVPIPPPVDIRVEP